MVNRTRAVGGGYSKHDIIGFVHVKQTETRARLIRTCDTCAHSYIYSTVRIYYDTTALQQCCFMYSGYTSRDSIYYCCRMHVPGTYILYRTYFATVRYCLPYAIHGSIDSCVVLVLAVGTTRLLVLLLLLATLLIAIVYCLLLMLHCSLLLYTA